MGWGKAFGGKGRLNGKASPPTPPRNGLPGAGWLTRLGGGRRDGSVGGGFVLRGQRRHDRSRRWTDHHVLPPIRHQGPGWPGGQEGPHSGFGWVNGPRHGTA